MKLVSVIDSGKKIQRLRLFLTYVGDRGISSYEEMPPNCLAVLDVSNEIHDTLCSILGSDAKVSRMLTQNVSRN